MGSAAQACRAIGLARSSLYRASQANEERREMQSRIIDFSEQNPRYGYRRVTALLRREGAKINTKRVQRVRRQESLQVRKKQRRTKRLGMSTAMRQRAERANQIWSWDFVHDQTQEGRPFRILTLIDEHTKQCLATHVGWSVRAVDVITVIEASIQRYGAPEHIRSDNGSEFIARAIQDWLSDNEIKIIYIKPLATMKSKLSTSSQALRGSNPSSRASTTNYATNVSTGKCLARCWKPGSLSNSGESSIINAGRIAPWAT